MSKSAWNLDAVTLPGRTANRLQDITCEINSGVTAVLGCSGAGKSSLLNVLAGFEKPASGTVSAPAECADQRLSLFWSPQDHGLWPHLTVAEHIEYVQPETPAVEVSRDAWLSRFGLTELKAALPESLSQGERSRLSVARTLASEAEWLVFDEPLTHVDRASAWKYWRIIVEHAQRTDADVIFSSHDPEFVLRFSDSVICLDAGRMVFSGLTLQLFYDAPSFDLAWLLGPVNWFGDAPQMREQFESTVPSCVRPSELVVSSGGDLQVISIAGTGELTELTIQSPQSDQPSLFYTTRADRSIRVGSSVSLQYDADARRPKTD